MSRALYRKYRPVRLGDVVGQPQVTEPLTNSLKQGKVSHAYLFIGPRGTGKTSVARIFAHEVNDFKYEIEDDYVDIIEIDGASNRGIDNIRELREKAAIAPTKGKYKIYIIDEVHMLTKEAFNALLKTLEEPPKHVIFIMATTDAYKVPVTITSRAQTYIFKLADTKTMQDFLRKVANEEKIQIDDEALEIVVRRGGGSFRDSLSLLDQISTLSDKIITKELVISAMGLPEDEKIAKLLVEYSDGNVEKITTLLKDLLSSGIKPETLAEEMIGTIVTEPKPELFGLLAKLPDVKAPFAEAKLLVALVNKRDTASTSRSGARPASPSPWATGTNPRFANLRTPHRQDTDTVPFENDNLNTESEETHPIIRFNWQEFVDKVQSLNDAVYSQLIKTSHEIVGDILHIYPEKKIVKTILARDNNKRILNEAADGINIKIHEVDEKPTNHTKDEVLSKISDIMGGEVRNDGGGNPFEE